MGTAAKTATAAKALRGLGKMASNPRWRRVLPLLGVLLPVAALSGEWEKGASVNVGTYYTTNVCLVNPAIADEEGKVVGTFTPRVNVSGRGARSSLNLRAAAEYNSLADSSVECPEGSQAFNIENRKAWVPSGSFNSNLEVIDNWANLYATAFATQSALNPFLSGGDENANALGNTNLIYQWAVGANVDRRLSRAWQLQADVQHNRQYNSENQAIGNSEENRATYDIGTRPFVSRFFYGSRGSYSEIDFEATGASEAFTNRLSRAELYLGVALTNALLVEGAYGVENNVFTSLNDDVDGAYWDRRIPVAAAGAGVRLRGLRGAIFRRYAALQRELPPQALDAAGGVLARYPVSAGHSRCHAGAARTECAGAAGHGGAGQPTRQRRSPDLPG
jgi:hypothetical protein